MPVGEWLRMEGHMPFFLHFQEEFLRISSKLRCQEWFVLLPLSFVPNLIHSILCVAGGQAKRGR